ncbi:MAG: hypothetical protein VB119_04185 [Candidatus Metalachnospira sp.]|nr:hypothetical protein [Candidatus Metalachnospira sp.]
MKLNKAFAVEVTQIQKIDTVIEAECEKDALKEAKKRYQNGEYKFGSDTIVAAEFEIKYE